MPKKGGCQGKLSFLGIYYEKVIKNQLTVSVVFIYLMNLVYGKFMSKE